MATNQTIKLKRGTTTPTTSNIASGEVAIDTSAQKFYVNDAGTIKEVGPGAAGDFAVDTDTLFVDVSADRVGINTSSPSYALDVAGSINVTDTSGALAGIFTTPLDYIAKFESTDASGYIILEDSDSTNNANRIGVVGDSLRIVTNGTEAIHITSAQDVGIGGTPASTYRLDVIDSGATLARIRSTADSDVSQFFYSAGTTATHNIYFGDTGNTAAGGIRYYHNGDNLTFTGQGNGTEMARFDSSGRFGINTTAPAYELDVDSTIHIGNDGGSGFTHSRMIFDANGAVRGIGSFYHNQTNDTEWFAGNPYNGADSFAITRNATASHADATANQTNALLKLTSTGDLILPGNGGSLTNSVDILYNGSTGAATIQADSSGGSTSILIRTSNSGTLQDAMKFAPDEINVYLSAVEEFRFASGGTFHADADIVAYSTTVASDAALKYNINPVENALDKLNSLDGVTFQWKRDDKVSAGVIAQDVEKVMPSAVKEVESLRDNSTHKAVDYNQIIALLVEAVKDQQKQIDELRK